MRSARQSHFSRIPRVNVRRSTFDRSHTHKTTFNAGQLVPVFLDEVLPGDTFSLDFNFFCRLSTPIVPFMDNLYLDYHFFYCPTRLVWSNFQKFMGEQENIDDSIDYLVPTYTFDNVVSGNLPDYFGLPVGVANKLTVNALPFRVYYRVFNEWYRDENIQSSSPWGLETGDGPDDKYDDPDSAGHREGTTLAYRCKRHDYFTSALPWPQKGPGVDIPLSGNAPIISNLDSPAVEPYIVNMDTGSLAQDTVLGCNGDTGKMHSWNGDTKALNNLGFRLEADLSNVNAVTINSLRQAFQLQKFYELNARGGTRYTEILRAHFGVISPDARLQRPEYLGGGSRRIVVKPVEQNSATDTTSPQGNLAAYAVVGDSKHVFTKSFVEHGYVIGIVSVRADLNYQQGINRLWSRETREDFYWPVFAHLGEQAILNKEIYAQGTSADDQVFGYQERYAEYRYKPSLITGKFRSGLDGGSLDMWHLAQYFENLPTLSTQFIRENPPVNRVVAVQDEPHFLLDSLFTLKCVRPMPVYSVPGLVDHF